MALVDKKLTELTEKLTAPADAWVHFVDPTDISQSPTGSSYKIKKVNFESALTDVSFGGFTNSLNSKSTPIDADQFPLMDSADSNKAKKLSWLNIKATLKTYFDTLYQAVLVSGTNIKTINGNSILGSGNLVISGGASEVVLNYQRGTSILLNATERVASTTAVNSLDFTEAVTKSGSLLTGPFYMLSQNVTKTGTISKLTYKYFPDSVDLSFELRVYAFKQNKDSTSIFDCRLLLEETLTSGSTYTVQKFNFVTADFLDANMIDGEFLVITAKKTGANNFNLLSQNLTIIY